MLIALPPCTAYLAGIFNAKQPRGVPPKPGIEPFARGDSYHNLMGAPVVQNTSLGAQYILSFTIVRYPHEGTKVIDRLVKNGQAGRNYHGAPT